MGKPRSVGKKLQVNNVVLLSSVLNCHGASRLTFTCEMEQISTKTRKRKSEDNEAKRVFSLLSFTFMFAFYFSWQHKTLYLHIKLTAAIRLNINRLSTGNKINMPQVFNLKETKLFKSIFEATSYYDQQKCELPISFIVWSMDRPSHHQSFFIHRQFAHWMLLPKATDTAAMKPSQIA